MPEQRRRNILDPGPDLLGEFLRRCLRRPVSSLVSVLQNAPVQDPRGRWLLVEAIRRIRERHLGKRRLEGHVVGSKRRRVEQLLTLLRPVRVVGAQIERACAVETERVGHVKFAALPDHGPGKADSIPAAYTGGNYD